MGRQEEILSREAQVGRGVGWIVGHLQDGPMTRQGKTRRGGGAAHLSELQGGDHQEDDAPEAEAGPIPVGQAGVGLSLQEL